MKEMKKENDKYAIKQINSYVLNLFLGVFSPLYQKKLVTLQLTNYCNLKMTK